MRSLNRVTLIGHLASDVEFKETSKGNFLSVFPIATNRNVKDENGKFREQADYHRIVAWGKLAEIVKTYLKKGMATYVEGRLVNNSFESKSGEKHYRSEIIVDTLNILTWKKDKSGIENINIEDIEEKVK